MLVGLFSFWGFRGGVLPRPFQVPGAAPSPASLPCITLTSASVCPSPQTLTLLPPPCKGIGPNSMTQDLLLKILNAIMSVKSPVGCRSHGFWGSGRGHLWVALFSCHSCNADQPTRTLTVTRPSSLSTEAQTGRGRLLSSEDLVPAQQHPLWARASVSPPAHECNTSRTPFQLPEL